MHKRFSPTNQYPPTSKINGKMLGLQMIHKNTHIPHTTHRRNILIVHVFYILFIKLLHLSCNKSANFSVLNVYFTEDNHGEKEDYTK